MSLSKTSFTQPAGMMFKVTFTHLFIAFYVILGGVAFAHLTMDTYAGMSAISGDIQADYPIIALLGKHAIIIFLIQLVAGVISTIALSRFSGYLVQRTFFPRMAVASGISMMTCGILFFFISLAPVNVRFISIFPEQTEAPFLLCLLFQATIFGTWSAWWLAKKYTPDNKGVIEIGTEIS